MYKIGIIPNIRIPTNCFLEDDTTDDKQVFTDDEIALLTDYLWKRYEQDHTYTAPLAILFPFVTGVRAGELCAMKFSDMIEDGKFIQIKRQRVKKLNQDGELKEYTFVEHAKARSRKKPLYIPTDGQKILSLVKESNELNGEYTKTLYQE